MAEQNKTASTFNNKVERAETWSGLAVEEFYGPKNPDREYFEKLGHPGEYPFTRGIFRNMYRGKYWTTREVCGLGSAKYTNERIKYLLEQGAGGPNPILDNPGIMGLDADHPYARGEVGRCGFSVSTQKEMGEMLEGIPIDEQSFSLVVASPVAPVYLASYLNEAKKRGIPFNRLKGSIQNEPIHVRYAGFETACPVDLALKTAVDIIEYCTKYVPRWNPTTINLYDLRENGITAAEEVAFGFLIAQLYIEKCLERGMKFDDFGPRFAFYCSSHIDFFEEIAKLRAARRMWAKMAKEKYGATRPESMKFRFAVHTAGCSLVPQQPLNNIVRAAYESLAAVLGGVQSVSCCAYDEPIALPTKESAQLAMRTQQIIAYETGVPNVADPLGGSYYLEELTDKMEQEIERVMRDIEERGGMREAIESGWLKNHMIQRSIEEQRRLENGERVIVGTNKFMTSESEKADEKTPLGVERVSVEMGQEIAEEVSRIKRDRDQNRARAMIEELKKGISKGEKENLIPYIMECLKADLSMGEIMGTIRQGYGYSYDPLGIMHSEF